MTEEVGLHRPNTFLVPLDVLDIATKLSKEELIVLLRILAGEGNKVYTSKAAEMLKQLGIIDSTGKINWVSDSRTKIRLIKTKEPVLLTTETETKKYDDW